MRQGTCPMEKPFVRLGRRLRYQLLNRMPYDRAWVFGIGLSKTGTTSLAEALSILGLRCMDNPPITRIDRGEIVAHWRWWLRGYDALTDLPAAAILPHLLRDFPNARFIYTTRNMHDWLRSCRHHFTAEMHASRVAQGAVWNSELCSAFYGSHLFDEDLYRAAYLRHDAFVRRAVPQARLLELDVTQHGDWAALCEFLDRPVPPVPFPRANVGRYRQTSAPTPARLPDPVS